MNRRNFMRNAAIGAGGLAIGGSSKSVRASGDQPNIIIIMADDLGLGDLGCFGSTHIKTPNLDAMAAGGIKLTSFYACAPVCSPSRSGLMTGRYPIRNGVINNFGPSRRPEAPLAPLVNKMGHGLILPGDRIIDGRDLMPVLKGGATAHEAIYYCYQDNLQAVRKGKWKYHRRHKHWTTHTPDRPNGPMLFNIIDDPEESYDLLNLYPDKAAELEGVMQEWEKTLPKETRRTRK